MGPLLYFTAMGVVLGAIWLLQGRQPTPANGGGGSVEQQRKEKGGGAEPPPPDQPVYGSYQYNLNESPSPDSYSAYGGITDNSSTSPQLSTGLTYGGAQPYPGTITGPPGTPVTTAGGGTAYTPGTYVTASGQSITPQPTLEAGVYSVAGSGGAKIS